MPVQEPSSGWLRGVLPLALAAVLAQGDQHGYALVQQLAAHGFGTIRGGALYPVLGRMETDGLVEARWEPGEGGPGRKVYRLTDAGRARLLEEAADWQRFSDSMDQLLRQGTKEEP
ncbi:PadR family transcriptional regulator [Streptomyces olivochromogenes]|uniref:PadR family transcriptional regulator n=1 Tax=Streptomyces olivochromogenes TaxID=1963 RepID=UPI001F35FC4E|nr:PadR family transcriptional regulator [Streptomyces olivochromogenes]MCF3131204.1 helix-turn-helix transcriptional regulator [Streptomyces olivochromogenes]